MAATPLDHPAVLEGLADGAWHSGVALGQACGLSRAAIWKQVRALRAMGLTIHADRRHGYRLAAPLDLLSEHRIRGGLSPATLAALESLDVLVVTHSTNAGLASGPAPAPGRMRAVVAEYQTGGRGRRGRRWLSPLGHGICLSVAWAFEDAPRDFPALSLVAGVAVRRALATSGVAGVLLKWPNDLMAADPPGKLGGILVEVAGEPGGPLRTVIGIGLNVRPITSLATELREEGGDAAAVALDDLAAGAGPARNELVAALLNGLHDALRCFGESGWQHFLADWRAHDYLADRSVTVTWGGQPLEGIARGIAADGSLLVETRSGMVPIVAGDVTLRSGA